MKTVDIKYTKVVAEMELIENEAGIKMNRHRQVIVRHVINHFTKEHIPPINPKDHQFEIPVELRE